MNTKTTLKWLLAAGAAFALSSCVDTYGGGGPGYGYGGGGYAPGYVVETLPGGYEPVFYGGERYYVSNGVYYRSRGGRYVVVERPRGAPVRGGGWNNGSRPGHDGGWNGNGPRPGGGSWNGNGPRPGHEGYPQTMNNGGHSGKPGYTPRPMVTGGAYTRPTGTPGNVPKQLPGRTVVDKKKKEYQQ